MKVEIGTVRGRRNAKLGLCVVNCILHDNY